MVFWCFAGVRSAAAENWLWPVPGHMRLSRGYSAAHDGLDISDGSIAGANIVATKSGTVKHWWNDCLHVSAGNKGCNCSYTGNLSNGFGNGLVIQHDDGTISSYGHMMYDSIPQQYRRVGARVNQGAVIGKVGSAGWSTGYHLHFTICSSYDYWKNQINNNPDRINYTYGGSAILQDSSVSQLDYQGDYVDYTAFRKTAKYYNPSNSVIQDLGIVLMDQSGKEIKTHHEPQDRTYGVGSSRSWGYLHEDTTADLGMTLRQGTEYKYKFFIKTNNKMNFSQVYTVKTLGTAKPNTPKLSADKKDYAAGDLAVIRWSADPCAVNGYEITIQSTSGEAYTKTIQINDANAVNASIALPAAGTYRVSAIAKGTQNSDVGILEQQLTVHDPLEVVFQQTLEDGTVEELKRETVKYGYNATAPSAPSMEGYTFQGWDKSYSNVKENLNINAKYKINRYTVKFVNDDGTLLKSEEVNYKEAVTPPENPTSDRTGYIFAGWNSNENECVKKNLTITASYVWNNNMLPIVVTLKECRYEEDGYTILYDITNYPESKTGGRAIVSLKTATGKLLATTESSAFTIPKDTTKTNQEIFVPYEGVATYAEIVIVNNFASGVPISASSTVRISRDWSDWSTTNPEGNYEVESRTEYRYRNKLRTTSSSEYLPDWTQTGSTWAWGGYGAWSGWSRTAYSNSDSRKVETRTVTDSAAYTVNNYYYYRYYNSSAGAYYYTYSSNMGGTRYTFSQRVGDAPAMYAYGTYSGHTGYVLKGNNGGHGVYFDSEIWFLESSQNYPAVTHTEYRYADRSKVYTYQYEKWDDWSEWSTEEKAATADCEVETRTVYRYKAATEDTEDISGEERTVTGKVSEEFAGKQIMLLVYKGLEPSDYNNEYIGQTVVGEDGSYSYTFTTREEPSMRTGDFTISLTLEGSTDLIYIDTIKAPLPVYTVEFLDKDGTLLSTQQVTRGDTAVLPENPVQEHYRFTGWSTSNTNIQYDTKIIAQYEKETFIVNWIDWDRRSVIPETYEYGSELMFPEGNPAEGYEFLGWYDENDEAVPESTIVTGNMNIAAKYEKLTYMVSFYDWEGTKLDVQEVEYGAPAAAPEGPAKDGMLFMGWNTSDYLNVKANLKVYPTYSYIETAETPVVDVESSTLMHPTTVHLSAEENAVIYYTTDGSEPDSYSNEYTDGVLIDRNTILKFIACVSGKNTSQSGCAFYQVSETEDTEGALVVKKSTWNVEKGEDITIDYFLSRNDTEDRSVCFYSLDENVASVTEDGKIHANNAGTAKIIVMTQDCKYADNCTVEVTDSTIEVESLNVSRQFLRMAPSEISKLEVEVSPAEATYPEVDWYSSDPEVAVVDEEGNVVASQYGDTVLRAYSARGNCYVECMVSVQEKSLQMSDDVILLSPNETYQLEAVKTGEIEGELTWSSSLEQVASIGTDGLVTAGEEGRTVITAQSADGAYEASCTVIVRAAGAAEEKVDLSEASAEMAESVEYTGEAAEPAIRVTCRDQVLEAERDYQIIWSSNVNAGTAKAYIVGKGDYTGILEKEFTIMAKDISGFTAGEIGEQEYTGEPIEPKVEVKDGEVVLLENRDYRVTYTNNVNAGTAAVSIAGMGNYTGTLEKSFVITVPVQASLQMSEDVILLAPGETQKLEVIRNGEIAGEIVWSSEDETVASIGTDGLVTAGEEGRTVITAQSADGAYEASCTVIVRAAGAAEEKVDLSEASAEMAESVEYTGEAAEPAIRVTCRDQVLEAERDYQIIWSSNVNAGTAKAYIVGKGDYTGILEKEFTIMAKDISGFTAGEIGEQEYTGEPIEPKVEVKDGEVVLLENRDYRVTYTNNVNAGTAAVSIAGMGNYTGTLEKSFAIVKTEQGADPGKNPDEDQQEKPGDVPQPSVPQPSVPQPSVPQPSVPQPSVPDNGTYVPWKVGEKATVSGVVYTSLGGAEAAYSGPENRDAKSLAIPSYVVVDGKICRVTEISENAFKNCRNLKKVVIGKYIKEVKAKAFYGCKKLKTVTIKSKVLNKVGKQAFKGIHKKAKIKVPKAKLKAYKKLLKGKGQAKTVKITK